VGWLVLASVAATAPDVASVDGAWCDGREGVFFGSRWRIVRAGKTPGCEAAGAAPPLARWSASSSFFLLPPLSLFSLEGPSLAGSFSLSAPRSRRPPPLLETPAPLRAASKCRDAIPSTGRVLLPGLSELAGVSTGAVSAGVGTGAPASVGGGLEGAAVAAAATATGAA
jgi:hypothetical protein